MAFSNVFKLLKEFKYFVYYYILGSAAIIEDIIYRRHNKCELVSCIGDVAVVTGGARGIGAEVVKQLLLCEMHIIIGCRDVRKGSEMVHKLRAQGVTTGSTSILPLDMACVDSIQAFATAVLKAKPSLHLLINNAGIMFPPYSETVDGMESQWAVNYMGPFLLSHLLLPRLHESAVGRTTKIVNVSSCAHHASYPIDFTNINMKNCFITQAAYAQSKMAQIMFTQQLDRQLRVLNSGVQVVSVHPGIVDTDIFNGTVMKTVFPWVPALLFKTPEEAGRTVMYAVLKAEGGDYISNGRSVDVSSLAQDRAAQQLLFNYSMQKFRISSFGGLIN